MIRTDGIVWWYQYGVLSGTCRVGYQILGQSSDDDPSVHLSSKIDDDWSLALMQHDFHRRRIDLRFYPLLKENCQADAPSSPDSMCWFDAEWTRHCADHAVLVLPQEKLQICFHFMLSGFVPLKDALVLLKIRSSLIQKLISSLQTNRRFKTSPLSTSDSPSPVIPTWLVGKTPAINP